MQALRASYFGERNVPDGRRLVDAIDEPLRTRIERHQYISQPPLTLIVAPVM